MKFTSCVPQKISKFTLGVLLLVAALGFTVVSLTILPIVGFALVIPLVILAVYFFRLHLNDQCEIDVT